MSEVNNPVLGYADSYRRMARTAKAEGRHQMVDMFSVVTDLERNIAPLFTAAQSELAALREELGQCKGEYDRSANRVSELQDQLAYANKSADTYLAAWEKCAEFRDASEQRLSAAEQRNETLSNALTKIIEMNRQQAKDQYGDAEKAESWSCITVARDALGARNAED